jgi:tetratricopeptide (TPR) repeat protein
MWHLVPCAFAGSTFDLGDTAIAGELQRPEGALIAVGPRLAGRPARGLALEERALELRMIASDAGPALEPRLEHRVDRLRWRAVRVYERALDRGGVDAPAVHVRLGLLFLDLGQVQDGVAQLEESLLESPDGPTADIARVTLADRAFEDADLTRAIRLYQDVRTPAPLAYAAYKEAWCWYNLADYDEATSAMLDAIDLAAGAQGLLADEARKDIARFAVQLDDDLAMIAIGDACDTDTACIDALIDRTDALRADAALPPLAP